MSQIVEDCARIFCVRCADIGLVCDFVIYGSSEKKTMDKTIMHMFEYHAINAVEMTTCMKLKIKENIHMDKRTYNASQTTSEFPNGALVRL
jgi:predicted small metal-binding protein